MGIDLIAGGRTRSNRRKSAKTDNVYVRLLVQLYEFLARRTNSKFNSTILQRLKASRTNLPPVGLARIKRWMSGKEDKIAVFVGTITDDTRLIGQKFPALTVCALRVTETARARILANGGKVITFDQLVMMAPKGSNTVLLRGRTSARVANKYFGTPGAPGSKTRPKIRAKGKNFEKARGRRHSRGFKL